MKCTTRSAEVVELPIALVGVEVDRLRPTLLTTIRETTEPVVVLDASEVQLISSAGLGLLVAAALLAREYGKRVEVPVASELFRESIALTGLAGHLGMDREPVGIS